MDYILELYGVTESQTRDELITLIETKKQDSSFSSANNRTNRLVLYMENSVMLNTNEFSCV